MLLHEKMIDSIEYNSKTFSVDFSFNKILSVYELFKDDDFDDLEKINIAYDILVKNYKNVDLETKSRVMDAIFKEIQQKKSSSDKKPSFCFVQDANYIFSSFYKDYGIDLIEFQDKLHFEKFIALFGGLSEKTIIKKIIDIRTKPLPVPNKHNQGEIVNLQKLKLIYRLEIEDEEQNEQDELRKLANSLIAFSETR